MDKFFMVFGSTVTGAAIFVVICLYLIEKFIEK